VTDPTTSDHVDHRARAAIKLHVPKSPLRKQRKSSWRPFCCASQGAWICLDRLVRSNRSF
jgi:hypothetical protein